MFPSPFRRYSADAHQDWLPPPCPEFLPARCASRVQDQRNEKRPSSRRQAFRRGTTTPLPRPLQVLCEEFSLCLLRGTLLQGTGGQGEGCLSLSPKRDHSQKQQGLLHFSPMFFSAVGWCCLVRKIETAIAVAGTVWFCQKTTDGSIWLRREAACWGG